MFKVTEDRGRLAVAGGIAPQSVGTVRDRSPLDPGWLKAHRLCDAVLEFADRHRRWIFLTVLVFYLAAFNGQWRVQSDAALYLSIGRNLAQGHGFTYLGRPDHLAYPGWPGVIAVIFTIFGSTSLVPVNVVMLLIALLTIAAVYRLFLLHAGRPTAVVVAAGTGLTKAFFCYGFELWTDMPFALGAMMFFAGYEGIVLRREPRREGRDRILDATFLAVGLLIAAATRPTIWPLLTAAGLAIFVHSLKRQINWKTFVGFFAGVLLLLGVCYAFGCIRAGDHGFGEVYKEYLIKRFTRAGTGNGHTHSIGENVRDLFSWAASDVLFQTRLGPICNALLSLLVLSLGVGLFRYRSLWGFWFCLLLMTILVSQETLDRYFLPVLPLLVFAWWDMLVRLNRMLPIQSGNLAFLVLLSFGGLMNLTKCMGIIAQQHERPFLANYDKGIYDVIPKFSRQLHDHVGDDAIVLVRDRPPFSRVTAFLSERRVIGTLGATVADLQTHPVYVIEPADADLQDLLKAAHLTVQPAIFTVTPSPEHGPEAMALTLHGTRKDAER